MKLCCVCPRALLCALLLVGPSACVVEWPVGSLRAPDEEPAPQRQADPLVDFLFVVDNSGSMCPNQEALVRAFFDVDCPIQDLSQVPLALQSPSPELAAQLSEECGFSQMLAAYGLDFRVGVISTDVGPCDNRFGLAELDAPLVCRREPEWGRRPQRGCLQAPPSWDQRFLTRKDSAIGTKFAALLHNVGVFGSAYERGLDAVDVFLDDTSDKAPGCDSHARELLREDAHLVLVFVTDEDDCSHQDGAYGFVDENAKESCAHAAETFPGQRDGEVSLPEHCYERRELLAPVSEYTERWREKKGDAVSAVLLGGLVPVVGEGLVAQGCLTLEDGSIGDACWESGGSSNQTHPGGVCDPSVVEAPCCTAEGASRYLEAVQALGRRGAAGSICGGGLREVLKQALAVVL